MNISGIERPEKFTFPFYYEPHKLSEIATKELQEYLENQQDFEHNFGLNSTSDELPIGKMFGVLVVENQENQLGYLCAFSGKLADKSLPKKFVPPIFNMRTEGSFYIEGENELNEINRKIGELKTNDTFLSLKNELKVLKKSVEEDLAFQRQKMTRNKKVRRDKKKIFQAELSLENFRKAEEKLTQESYNDQFYYKEFNEYYQQKIEKLQIQFNFFNGELIELKKSRKEKSNYLQQTLFSKYAFLNLQKELKSLLDIFNDPNIKPPAGSGECAAPKLLQYAFQNNLKPICMAEFWWGNSPNSAVRKHKNFYPACQSRCKPILAHMLNGVVLEENKMVAELQFEKELDIFFEDDNIIVVNKPPEFLSVPGKEIKDSVLTRIKEKYPDATGSMLVHRLDMSTSGILLFTKTAEANKNLQSQFIKRTIKKKYIALLDGNILENEGTISLPLRLDLDDRPRQLVDFENGKAAITNWKVIRRENNKTLIHFYPITGRTHQLRVHSAHKNGLNAPIIGDDLYGKKENRLHLHAEFIEFLHPKTGEKVAFTIPAEF